MMFVAALMTSAAIATTMAPSPFDLCDALAHDSATRGYVIADENGDFTRCMLEDFGPDGQGWDVYDLEDIEVEDYPEVPRHPHMLPSGSEGIQGDELDCECSEYVITMPPVVIFSTIKKESQK